MPVLRLEMVSVIKNSTRLQERTTSRQGHVGGRNASQRLLVVEHIRDDIRDPIAIEVRPMRAS